MKNCNLWHICWTILVSLSWHFFSVPSPRIALLSRYMQCCCPQEKDKRTLEVKCFVGAFVFLSRCAENIICWIQLLCVHLPLNPNLDNPNSQLIGWIGTQCRVEITLFLCAFICLLHSKFTKFKVFYLALLCRIKREVPVLQLKSCDVNLTSRPETQRIVLLLWYQVWPTGSWILHRFAV